MKITYSKSKIDQQFYITLKKRIYEYFEENNLQKEATPNAWAKLIGLFLVYIGGHILLFSGQGMFFVLLGYILLGVTTIFLALNVAHDAAHNTFSGSKKVNNILIHVFDLLGASGLLWKHKHIYSHHAHVNIPGLDSDIKQSDIVRIFPNAVFKWFHKYQHFYMPFLYSIYTLFWLMIRDFKDYYEYGKHTNLKERKMSSLAILVFGKMFFVFRFLLFPYFILSYSGITVLLGFLLFHIAASLTVTIALISTHVGEDAIFPQPDENGRLPHSWIRHQLLTTSDFATSNQLISHLFGGFNHHVIHHLFPNISHIHYLKLTPLLKQVCAQYGMPYKSKPTFFQAGKSHFKFLKLRSVFEEW